MPNATLASIVFLIGLNMIDIRGLNDIRSKIKSEYYLAIITALTVILVSVLWGIIISIILSLLLHLSHSYRPVNSILVKNKEGNWILVPVEYGKSTEDGIIVYRFNRDLYYANSDRLHDEIIKLVENADPPLKWFVLDAGGFEAMDYTSSEMLKNLHHELVERNVKFVVATRMPELKDQLKNLGLMNIIGSENIYNSAFEAIEAFKSYDN
jgi:MFS superfamily sulfate permease-like transporter